MKLILSKLFLVSALFLTACDVGFDHPPSGSSAVLDPGVWQITNDKQEQVGYVKVTPEDNGAFSALYFENLGQEKGDEMNVRGSGVAIGRNRYLSGQLISKSGTVESGMYMLVRYEKTEPNKITLWGMSHDAVKDAVNQGRVKANLEESSVGEKIHVTGAADDVAAFINSDPEKLFTRKYTLTKNAG